ncbi:MAG: GIY-YIG nuclease family protein [Patescibacteria group bacterium]
MFFYTYVLKSKKDDKLYIGSTSDIITKLKSHNSGEVQSTKSRRPFELIYFEVCTSKKKAEERELYFKTGFGRGYLKNRL